MLGSGVFASGAGETGGRLIVSRIETDAIYSDARMPAGTPDQISGVFTVHGAYVSVVRDGKNLKGRVLGFVLDLDGFGMGSVMAIRRIWNITA